MKKVCLFTLIFGALLAVSCGRGYTNQKTAVKSESHSDSLSQVFYRLLDGDEEMALSFIDSLESVGVFSGNVANSRRSQVYSEHYKPRVSELYALRALKDGKLRSEDANIFYFTYNMLINSVQNVGNIERALTYATEALAAARADTSKLAQSYVPDFLTSIGGCQFSLNRNEEGNASYNKAFALYEEVLKRATSFSWFYPELMLAIDAIESNSVNDSVRLASEWLPRLDQAYQKTVSARDIPDYVKDDCTAEMEMTKAKFYARAGNRTEAEKHYRAYLATNYAFTVPGQKTATAFLESTGRWNELVGAIEQVDSFYMANESHLSMRYLNGVLGAKYKAQLHLSQHDGALRTASRIVNLLDSVDEHLRQDAAAELATIYQTQEKESKIAEQQADLRRQRTIAAGIALMMLILFMSVIIAYRHFAAKRLEAEHQKLIDAYAQLEESNAQLESKNSELAVANERAEESSKMKTNFIQQISHEIRTPLNILSGFTQIVTAPDAVLDESTKRSINNQIKENTDRITGLVNKMLELSDANSRTVIDRTDDVTALQIALQAVDDTGISESGPVSFTLQADEQVGGLMLHTSQLQAARALALLLDNARKFINRPNEKVEQTGKVLLRLTADDRAVHYAVEDTGIGVPTAEAERIFEEFVQLDEYYDGTGIGLTVARSIARRLGGDVVLDRTFHPGARFVLTLPL